MPTHVQAPHDAASWQAAYAYHLSSLEAQPGLPTPPHQAATIEVLGLGRAFYPRPYVASAIQHVIPLPWATEFFILPFWFFFFSLGLVSIWLVILYAQTTLHVESRLLRRETRGFSRAQTGDALTSVVPLAWSISMLMHASTHSFNFDDNTAGAVFSFNVLAYQWGWNYYFPSDVVTLVCGGAKRVGHSSVETFVAVDPYAHLLARYRYEYVRRASAQGLFVSRTQPTLTPLAVFTYAPDPTQPHEPAAYSSVVAAAEERAVRPLAQWRTLLAPRAVGSLAALVSQDGPQSATVLSLYAWLSATPPHRTLVATTQSDAAAQLRRLVVTPALVEGTRGSLGGWSSTFPPAPQAPAAVPAPLRGPTSADLHAASLLHPLRGAHSTALVGNRLCLVHQWLSQSGPLPTTTAVDIYTQGYFSHTRPRPTPFALRHAPKALVDRF